MDWSSGFGVESGLEGAYGLLLEDIAGEEEEGREDADWKV